MISSENPGKNKNNLHPQILRWQGVIGPFSMLFCFLHSFFSLTWLLWFRLWRTELPRFFAQMNPWVVLYLGLLFLGLLLWSLQVRGYLPWKASGRFQLWLRSTSPGSWLYFRIREMILLDRHSFSFVFMYFWEKIPTMKTVFLLSLGRFLWTSPRRVEAWIPVALFSLGLGPRMMVALIFLGEALFSTGFHHFYSWIFLLFLPLFHRAHLCFWDAWSQGFIKHLEAHHLRVEEGEDENYYLHPLSSPFPPEFPFWVSLWQTSMDVAEALEKSRDLGKKWESLLSLFLLFLYFLSWSSIFLRFFSSWIPFS